MKLGHKSITTVAQEIHKRPDILSFLGSSNSLIELFSLPNDLPSQRVELYKKAYFGVGNTGCYRMNLPNQSRLFVKMEYSNSMGNSHYSRFWIVYLFISEVLDVISPNESKILEVTSGSSGIALASASEVLGYDVTILVPSCLPESRIAPMRRKNTTIIRVQGYIDSCILELRDMIKTGEYFATNHSDEKANIITYVFSRIGHEFVREFGTPDYSILAFGNGSSTEAITRVFKETNSNTKTYSYRPDFNRHPDEIVFGLLAPNIDLKHVPEAEKLIDRLLFTSDINISETLNQYQYDNEIINLGPSSLYGIHFAHEIAKHENGKSFFTIGYDKNDRY